MSSAFSVISRRFIANINNNNNNDGFLLWEAPEEEEEEEEMFNGGEGEVVTQDEMDEDFLAEESE